MNLARFELRQLLIPAVAVLLLAGAGGAAAAWNDGAATAPAPQEKSDIERGCCGGCGRAAAVDGAPGCGRAGGGGCCRMGRRGDRGPGHGMGRGPGRGGGRHGGGPPAVMQTARALVHDHRDAIERQVEMLDNGVVTVTRAPEDAEAAEAIRRHVEEMKQVLESGGRVRRWDPLFRELFDRSDEIVMEIEELDDGMRVTETSADPEVAKLIQAHARKVTEFIERGPAAVHEETPLPEGYAVGSQAGAGSRVVSPGQQ